MQDADSIDVAELRRSAARYVGMAAAGTRVPVIENGTLVAYLVAPETGSVLDRVGRDGASAPGGGPTR